MQAPPSAKAAASAQRNLYGPLAQPKAEVRRKDRKKIQFEFKSDPPAKPLPMPKVLFDHCCIPKLASVCTSKLDETRYSSERAKYLISMQPHYGKKVRVATLNVLVKSWEKKLNPSHPAYDASQLWSHRVQLIAAAVNELRADIFACQELFDGQDFSQEEDLYNYIGGAYTRYSEKSPDGERNTLFLKRDVFKVIHTHTYICAEKAIGLMIVIFRDQKMVIINTHFSIETNARETQARFVSELVKEQLKEKALLILMLDGNLFPNDPYNVSTKAGWDGPYIESILKTNNSIEDAFNKSLFGHVGSLGSYTNDQHNAEPFKGRGSPGIRLDRIFVSAKIDVFIHCIEPFIANGKYPSDHQAVVADLHIPMK